MARMCGILKIALREDDPGTKIRLAPQDVEGETVQGKPLEPGLYFCGQDAWDKFAPRVLERLKRTPRIHHDGKPVTDANGDPAMFAAADATLSSIDPRLLV
jgi:hypothetical protein